MDIQIEVLGRPNKWVVNQSPIRIGRGPACEVTLPARQFPSVGTVHAELEIVNNTLRVKARDSAYGDLYLNDQPVEPGAIILSGDILRLGAQGPDLKIAFADRTAPSQGHEATRVMQVEGIADRERTRLMNVQGGTFEAPMPSAPASRVNRPPGPSFAQDRPTPYAQPATPAAGSPASHQDVRDRRPQAPKLPALPPLSQAAAGQPMPSTAALESKLRSMQIMQAVSIAIMLGLAACVVLLNRQISQTHDEIRALRAQDQDAVGQFTPALDARLNAFGQRMDAMDGMFKAGEERMESGMDAKMKAAQDQLFTSLDVRMKATEDHMVNRMNTDLPPLLDKYMTSKLAQFKQ